MTAFSHFTKFIALCVPVFEIACKCLLEVVYCCYKNYIITKLCTVIMCVQFYRYTKVAFSNPRRACAGGLLYLSCVSVTTLTSTSFISTFQVRYVRLSFRLYSIFNW